MILEDLRLELGRVTARELSFVLGLGYEFAGVRERSSEAVGPSLEGTFANEAADRVVRVVYIPGRDARRAVAITRIELLAPGPVDEFDYASTGGLEVCMTRVEAHEGFAAGVRRHLRDAGRELRDRFGPVLTGRSWWSDHIDWGGLK